MFRMFRSIRWKRHRRLVVALLAGLLILTVGFGGTRVSAITSSERHRTDAFISTDIPGRTALFDDGQRASEVFGTLNKRCGPWAADVFRACKEGAHEAYGGDIGVLVGQTQRLAAFVRALP